MMIFHFWMVLTSRPNDLMFFSIPSNWGMGVDLSGTLEQVLLQEFDLNLIDKMARFRNNAEMSTLRHSGHKCVKPAGRPRRWSTFRGGGHIRVLLAHQKEKRIVDLARVSTLLKVRLSKNWRNSDQRNIFNCNPPRFSRKMFARPPFGL